MRILLLAHSFNSLTQRLHAELAADGHVLSVEFDIADSVTEDAVALFRPDVVVAPYLRRAVPHSATPDRTAQSSADGPRSPTMPGCTTKQG